MTRLEYYPRIPSSKVVTTTRSQIGIVWSFNSQCWDVSTLESLKRIAVKYCLVFAPVPGQKLSPLKVVDATTECALHSCKEYKTHCIPRDVDCLCSRLFLGMQWVLKLGQFVVQKTKGVWLIKYTNSSSPSCWIFKFKYVNVGIKQIMWHLTYSVFVCTWKGGLSGHFEQDPIELTAFIHDCY